MSNIRKHDTWATAFQYLLRDVMYQPDHVCRPRGLEIREKIAYSFTVQDPRTRILSGDVRGTPLRYFVAELAWYLSGNREVRNITPFASLWARIADPQGHANSNYGYLNFFEKTASGVCSFRHAYDELVKDADSRKSVVIHNQPKYQQLGQSDTICTVSNQYFLRENQLSMVVSMRSSDSLFGMTYDVPWFTFLQETMALLLSKNGIYPGIELGNYTHMSGSMHVYAKDFALVEDMVGGKNSIKELSVRTFPKMAEPLIVIDDSELGVSLSEDALILIDVIAMFAFNIKYNQETYPGHIGVYRHCISKIRDPWLRELMLAWIRDEEAAS